jgi:hypothetical protein
MALDSSMSEWQPFKEDGPVQRQDVTPDAWLDYSVVDVLQYVIVVSVAN